MGKEIEARSMIGEIESILDALNLAHVRYLVVGGVAVVLHGYLRTTADLDLIIQLDRDNVLRVIRALQEHQYRPRAPVAAEEFAEQQVREQWIREKGLAVFTLWSPAHPTLEIDLFVSEPFDFDAVYARALRVPLEKTEATVIAHRRSDRPQARRGSAQGYRRYCRPGIARGQSRGKQGVFR